VFIIYKQYSFFLTAIHCHCSSITILSYDICVVKLELLSSATTVDSALNYIKHKRQE
jgi:hypothetical protein